MIESESLSDMQRRILLEAFQAAVARCQADNSLSNNLPAVPDHGRLVLIAAGKAAVPMAEVAEAHYEAEPGWGRVSGIVVIPKGVEYRAKKLLVIHAAHPLPDESSEQAARAALTAVSGLGAADHVVLLLSGGASSLLCAPADGITLVDKRATTTALFEAGATIDEINTVRKAISAIKGGHLARACHPAPVTTLAISDVVGDDPATIGSGPTVPAPDIGSTARVVIERYGLDLPASVRRRIETYEDEQESAWPLLDYRIIARPLDALRAAADCVARYGYTVSILGDDIEGEARDAADWMAGALTDVSWGDQKFAFLSGGEVTVTFDTDCGANYGGPNREFALALARRLPTGILATALVADTDGVDGQSGQNGPVAGAFVDGSTIHRARKQQLDPESYLRRHDSGTFFEQLGDELVTGPTNTNVNDFRMLLVN